MHDLELSDPTDFAAAVEDEGASAVAGKLGVEPDTIETWHDLAEMSLLKGMGITNANVLAALGVDSIAKLAGREPEALREEILATHGKAPSLARIKVWVYTARRRTAGP